MKKPVTKTPVKAKPVPKAKAPHHKPAPVTKAVRTARHAAAVKAARTRAANAKKAKHHTVRKLALGEGVACCSAEALAMSARLAGLTVSDEDVLALYWRTAVDADAGASILATLEGASRFGLAGIRPVSMDVASTQIQVAGELAADLDGEIPDRVLDELCIREALGDLTGTREELSGSHVRERHALILGIGDPAPHAVLATADGWWSWGELYEPWTDDIDEAWEVTWPDIR